MKTDNQAHIGKHAFEIAGLGLAPFRFLCVHVNAVTIGFGADAITKPGGSCDYCGTAILNEFHIQSADGKNSKVGCDCIMKAGDGGIMRAYKSSPAYRLAQNTKRQAKAARVTLELDSLLATHRDALSALPHPRGFVDRATGRALTLLDSAQWLFAHSGASGRASLLKSLRARLAGEPWTKQQGHP